MPVLDRPILSQYLSAEYVFKYVGPLQLWTLPGLVFADDLVLLAESTEQLQRLVDISANHLASLKLTFDAKKSAVLRFSVLQLNKS